MVYNAGRKAEVLDEFGVLKYLFETVPQCIPLVALISDTNFMRELHLSGVVRITHFVHANDVIQAQFIQHEIKKDVRLVSFFW